MSEAISTRLETLSDSSEATTSRFSHWKESIWVAPRYWLLGSGLGTYRYVYLPYQKQYMPGWYFHAENQYLEALVEGGLIGLGLLFLMMGLMLLAVGYLLRNGKELRDQILGVVGLFAFTSQALQSFTDFGLYMPANMALLALICGAVAGRAALLAESQRERKWSDYLVHVPRSAALGLSPLLACGLLAANGLALGEVRNEAAVEDARLELRVTRANEKRMREELGEPIDELTFSKEMEARLKEMEHALRAEWDDADTHRAVAELYIARYRDQTFKKLRAIHPADRTDAQLRALTELPVLHRYALQLADEDKTGGLLKTLRNEPEVLENLKPAVNHLLVARRQCPLMAWAHLRLAELAFVMGDPKEDEQNVARAVRLAPSDPDVLFAAGRLDFNAGRVESAYAHWRQCLNLTGSSLRGPGFQDQTLKLVGDKLSFPDLLAKVLPDSPGILLRLAETKYNGEGSTEQRQLLIDRAVALLDSNEMPDAERYYLQARANLLKGRLREAIDGYDRALQVASPEPAAWHYELANILLKAGRKAEALEHAQRAAQLQPAVGYYQSLVQKIESGQTP